MDQRASNSSKQWVIVEQGHLMNQPSQNIPTPNINTTEAGAATTTIVVGPELAKKGSGLVSTSSKFNLQACRRALSIYVILDEQPFKAVEDCLTSIQNLNYLTLTAHFVDNDWSYQKRIISFTVIPNHRGDKIGKKIEEAAEKFQVAFGKLEESSYKDFFGEAGPPTSSDCDTTRAFATFLKLFYEATKVFCSSQHDSIHATFHQLSAIYCELQNASLNLNTIFASVAEDMLAKYDKYWDMYATKSEVAIELITLIKEDLSKMYKWYKKVHDKKHNSPQPTPMAVDSASHYETFAAAVHNSHMARAQAFEDHLKEKDSIDQQNELEGYYSSKCVKMSEKFDILAWWKFASESAFSTGGRVIETFISSLKPKMAEALICTQNWIKPSLTCFKDLNLSKDVDLSEEIIKEFQGMSVGNATTTGDSSSQPPSCG
ncbi:zinc finger BED domain-containing protein RICESLEEPER 2-like [Cicer arietinum]|uniref:zinc finger BED domain-containing protein RICESLEEPER 2-like n=1 Tax=Cicer arietinum TaxID=3827 RepID=UPI003CC64057